MSVARIRWAGTDSVNFLESVYELAGRLYKGDADAKAVA